MSTTLTLPGPEVREITVTEVLEAARDRVAQGWCQGRYREGESYCSIGAVNAVFDVLPYDHDAYNGAWGALQRQIPGFGLISWNDAPGRTQDEVLALFDAAIEASR